MAIQAGYKGLGGAVGLTVKNTRFEDVGRGIYTDRSGSKDFYIADNVFIGKSHPDRLEGWIGSVWQGTLGFPTPVLSELAVKVYGSGHVIAHNYVANFHDGIDHATYGAPDGNPDVIRDRMPVAIDIYNNDITNVDDNCIEADGAMYNVRVLRNRCFNQGHRSLSTQPILSGPAYFIRNVVYHAPEGGSVKFTANSAGVLVYHNTFTSEVLAMGPAANQHYRNNLILGQGAADTVFAVETTTNYSSSDYNGFRLNPGVEHSSGRVRRGPSGLRSANDGLACFRCVRAPCESFVRISAAALRTRPVQRMRDQERRGSLDSSGRYPRRPSDRSFDPFSISAQS